MTILIHVVVGELYFMEGDIVFHPVTSCSRTVGVEVESEITK